MNEDKILPVLLENMEKVIIAATSTFNSEEAAIEWVALPCLSLGNKRPFELLATDEGTETVLGILVRIEHGFPA